MEVKTLGTQWDLLYVFRYQSVLTNKLPLQSLECSDKQAENLKSKRDRFQKNAAQYQKLLIPRRFSISLKREDTQIHDFADASEKSYAVCLYISGLMRSNHSNWLHTARSKVALLMSCSIIYLTLFSFFIARLFTLECFSYLRSKIANGINYDNEIRAPNEAISVYKNCSVQDNDVVGPSGIFRKVGL